MRVSICTFPIRVADTPPRRPALAPSGMTDAEDKFRLAGNGHFAGLSLSMAACRGGANEQTALTATLRMQSIRVWLTVTAGRPPAFELARRSSTCVWILSAPAGEGGINR